MAGELKLMNEVLTEAKQVGVIYHFTNPGSLVWILAEDMLESSSMEFVSFTRDFNLKNPYTYNYMLNKNSKSEATSWSSVRIAFDGDMMSSRYKIEPYSDKSQGFGRTSTPETSKPEAEERINQQKVVGILKYIKQIDILSNVDWKEDHLGFSSDIEDPISDYTDENINNHEEYMDFLKRLFKEQKWSKSYKIAGVTSFNKPVR